MDEGNARQGKPSQGKAAQKKSRQRDKLLYVSWLDYLRKSDASPEFVLNLGSDGANIGAR